MSRIVSPAPPVRITIDMDRVTGVSNMVISQEVPVEMVLKTFEAIKISIMQTRIQEVIHRTKPNAEQVISNCAFELAVMSHATLLLQTIENRLIAQAETLRKKSTTNPSPNPGESGNGAS